MKVQGKEAKQAAEIVRDAQQLAAAGVFSLVLECLPTEVSSAITSSIAVPTIGIGAGVHCDAQILVLHDMLGFEGGGYLPRFVRRFAELDEVILNAVSQYQQEVTGRSYPGLSESFAMREQELESFESQRYSQEHSGEEDSKAKDIR